MSKIRFKTESGSSYTLDLETHVLVREGVVPLISVNDGRYMPEPDGDGVFYDVPPTVGQSFIYYHPTLSGCGSTPVVSIEKVNDDA